MLDGGVREPSAQRIGPYEIILDIGSGGMGTISLARATGAPVGASGFARLVAIKRPHGALVQIPEVLQRFLDEARLLAQVHHANVVGIHQIGSDAGGHFVVLDYIEGGTLGEMIDRGIVRRKKLPPPIVMRILSDVLAGLHAVHEAADVDGMPLRMLHRDVSAQNVLVGKDGVARLADFGIAKAVTSSTVTDKAYLQGRIPYMPPEYLRREEVDRRLDVYAAGVTMWTALAGHLPWPDASEAQIIHNVVYDGIPPLPEADVVVAPVVREVITRATDRDPDARYGSAREMLDALEDIGRHTGWIASHAEVAAFVDDLMGRELRARRGAIAKRLAVREGRPSSPESAPSAVQVIVAGSTPTEERSRPSPVGPTHSTPPNATAPTGVPLPTPIAVESATAEGLRPPMRSHRGAALAVVLLAALGAAAIAWRMTAPSAPMPTPASTESAATALTASATASTSASASVSAPQPATSAAPSTSVEAPAVSTQRVPARTGTPNRHPGSSPGSSTPAGLPTGITTTNPYRDKPAP